MKGTALIEYCGCGMYRYIDSDGIEHILREPVKCKDCKYWQTSKIKGSKDYHTCMCVRLGKEGIIAFADDFCSRGELK